MPARKEESLTTNFVFISPQEHFSELLNEACEKRRVQILPHSHAYLINLLQHYIDSKKLFSPFILSESEEKPPETFAELYLFALNSEEPKNREIMRILAERSLYLSGFFAEGLSNKAVDIDYYMNIGASAYSNLSAWTRESSVADLYKILGKNFDQYAALISYISEKSALQSEANILNLYERYLKTGSKLAEEKLNSLGVTTLPKERLKLKKL